MPPADHNISLSISALAKLTRLHPRTVSARLAPCAFEKRGAAHLYRLADALPLLVKGVGSRERLAELQAALLELDLEERRGTLVDTRTVREFFNDKYTVIKQKVLATSIPTQEKEDLFNELRGIPAFTN
jgi:hypothetical protein